MQTKESLVVNRNFKVTPSVDAAIYDDAAELGLDDSKYLRACVFLAGPLLKAHPVLAKFNRRELEELAANIGNTLVIRPAAVEVRRGDW